VPRIRSIKPEITSDRKLASVSRDARLVFIYTWTIADDDGLFRAETRQLLGDLFPFEPSVSPEDLRRLYGELTSIEVIRWRETVDGSLVGEIVNWSKHQHIKNRAKSFLLTQLTDSSLDSTEALRRISPDPTEALGVRSLESGVLSQESGVRRTTSRSRAKKPRAASQEPATWVQTLTDVWLAQVGSVTHGRLGKALKPIVDKHGVEVITAAIEIYGSADEGPKSGRSVEQFAQNFQHWHRIAETPIVDPVSRELTDRGRRVGVA
jgi:hypothetical protein